jgi:hypothetical protein
MKMTPVFITLLILLPVSGIAQDYSSRNQPEHNIPGISQMNMQKIQQMQKCIESVDKTQLQSIEQLQTKFDDEISSLCASGKRDTAQKKAIAYAKQIMNNPAIKAMQKCGEIAKGMMPDMPFMDMDKDMSGHHVCESY